MTIAASLDLKAGPFSGDGSTVGFYFLFPITSNTQVTVLQEDVSVSPSTISTLILGVDYTVDIGNKKVTLTTAPLTTDRVFILADYEEEQLTDLVNQGRFFPQIHEDAFDYMTLLTKQLRRDFSRIVVDVGGPVTDPTIKVDGIIIDGVDYLDYFRQKYDDVTAAAAAAAVSASAASDSATLAQQWATKLGGLVNGAGRSARAWAEGASIASAKRWANDVSVAVTTGYYSSKAWAVSALMRGVAGGGSSKDWATYTGGTVDDTERSSKYYALASQAAFDAFDGVYLGAKSTAPTVDNNGDPLTTGLLYTDTTTKQMYYYNGSAWTTVPIPNSTTTVVGGVETATYPEMTSGASNKFPDALAVKTYVDNNRNLTKIYTATVSGSIDLDLSQYTQFDLTLTGTAGLNFINLPDPGEYVDIYVYMTHSGGPSSVIWGPSILWSGGYGYPVGSGAGNTDLVGLQIDSNGNAWGFRVDNLSATGGAPVVESGININGAWTKWADGTMRCTSPEYFLASLNAGAFDQQSWTLPVAPANDGHVIGSSTTGVYYTFCIVSGSSTGGTREVFITNIGSNTATGLKYKLSFFGNWK